MAGAVPGQHFRHLLRSGDADVSEDATMQRFGVIKVDDIFREIGTVARNQMEARDVWQRIQLMNEREVLLPCRLDFKAENRAIVR